jgi:hypothetical protein
MKKYLYLIIGLILLFPTFTLNAFGIDIDTFKNDVYRPDNLPANTATIDAPVETKINIIMNFAINLILYASGGVAVLFLIIGAIRYITSFGVADKATKAKKTIMYALIGLLAVILAYALVTNIISLIFKSTV